MNFYQYLDNRNARKYAYKMMMHHRGLGDEVRADMRFVPNMNWSYEKQLNATRLLLEKEKFHENVLLPSSLQ